MKTKRQENREANKNIHVTQDKGLSRMFAYSLLFIPFCFTVRESINHSCHPLTTEHIKHRHNKNNAWKQQDNRKQHNLACWHIAYYLFLSVSRFENR